MSDAASCLNRIAQEQGAALIGDPRLLELRLRAEAEGDAAAVDVLLAAADAGVPQALQTPGADPDAVAAQFAAARLVDLAAAVAAVKAWGAALRQMEAARAAETASRQSQPATTTVAKTATSVRSRLLRPAVLVPVGAAMLALLGAGFVPSPRSDPVPVVGGSAAPGTVSTPITGPVDAGGTSSTAGPGTETVSGTSSGGDPPGSGGDEPPDPEAELRAMFPALSNGCPRKTDNSYGVVHIECAGTVGTWLIRFESEAAAGAFMNGAVGYWQAPVIPWQDPASGAAGFVMLLPNTAARGASVPQELMVWNYTSPASARTVVAEGSAQPGFGIVNWWFSLRVPVVTA
jgi:hypothetical protein